jgi:hypothetical protein
LAAKSDIAITFVETFTASATQVRSDWHKKWQHPNFASLRPFPGVGLEALKLLHLERGILFHGKQFALLDCCSVYVICHQDSDACVACRDV